MIKYIATRFHRTDSKPLAAGSAINEEGTSLVFIKENGKLVVKPSTGAAGEIFAGVSTGVRRKPKYLNKVENHTVTATGVVELSRTPVIAGVWLDGTQVASIGATPVVPTDDGEANLLGNKLYAKAGQAVKVIYQYEPTVTEAQQEVGDLPINGDGESATGMYSFVILGTVATTMFDVTSDWTGVVNPRLGADGRFTAKGSGTLLANVFVENAPTAEADYLELSIKAL